jgi:hypothetical protein
VVIDLSAMHRTGALGGTPDKRLCEAESGVSVDELNRQLAKLAPGMLYAGRILRPSRWRDDSGARCNPGTKQKNTAAGLHVSIRYGPKTSGRNVPPPLTLMLPTGERSVGLKHGRPVSGATRPPKRARARGGSPGAEGG